MYLSSLRKLENPFRVHMHLFQISYYLVTFNRICTCMVFNNTSIKVSHKKTYDLLKLGEKGTNCFNRISTCMILKDFHKSPYEKLIGFNRISTCMVFKDFHKSQPRDLKRNHKSFNRICTCVVFKDFHKSLSTLFSIKLHSPHKVPYWSMVVSHTKFQPSLQRPPERLASQN